MKNNNKNFNFEQFINNNANQEIPSEVELRLRKRLAEFRKKIELFELSGKKFKILNMLRSKTKLTSVMAAAILIISLGIYLVPWSKDPGKAFAAVAEQFEKAKTFTCKIFIKQEGLPDMDQELLYKAPGYARINITINDELSHIGIINMVDKKGINILPSMKQYIETDVNNVTEEQFQIDLIDNLRTLPKFADEILGKREIDGRMLQGYLVKEEGMKRTVWLDANTEELVRIDMEFLNITGVNYAMTDFEFDVALDDSLFDLTPPKGYEMMKRDVSDASELPDENDLVNFIRYLTSQNEDGLFPPLNDVGELVTYVKELIDKIPEEDSAQKEKIKKTVYLGMMFWTQMSKENDWHYEGENVKIGSADIPICWWKPEGSTMFRVLYGNLELRDVDLEKIRRP